MSVKAVVPTKNNLAAIEEVNAHFNQMRLDDELRKSRAIALGIACDVARDRAHASGTHPGADAILTTAGEYFDFIWNGAKS